MHMFDFVLNLVFRSTETVLAGEFITMGEIEKFWAEASYGLALLLFSFVSHLLLLLSLSSSDLCQASLDLVSWQPGSSLGCNKEGLVITKDSLLLMLPSS